MMDSLETFVRRTHRRSEGPMPSVAIGKSAAHELIRRVDEHALAELASAARDYLPAVMGEVEELERARVANPRELARRAVLFGLATPNRDETASLGWALAAAPKFHISPPADLVETRYQNPRTGSDDNRIGLRQSLTAALEDVYSRFEDITPEELTATTLETVCGVGPKVARMIIAVANPEARVWTVDLWHIRQLLWAAGREYRVRASVDVRAYRILEES